MDGVSLGRQTTPESVLRVRLFDLIDEQGPAPVTLITAPAGYGKTTLVRQWLARHPECRCAWFHINAKHNALDQFLQRLWQIIDGALSKPHPAPPDLAIEHILERLDSYVEPIVLVFDVYTRIDNDAIHRAMYQLFEALPDTPARILLLGRHLPAIPLARLRAKHRLRHLTQDDLAFTLDEVQRLFAGRSFDSDTLVRLTDRTGGWITALQLAGQALDLANTTNPSCVAEVIASLPGNRALADYIAEEVLAYLPDDLRTFVLDTSVLTELDPVLCNAVLQIDSSEAFLKQVEDLLVFASRPATHTSNLVYHPLFAESVQWLRGRRFSPPVSNADLRLRAAQWYHDRRNLPKAAEYALTAEAWPLASELMGAFLAPADGHFNVWESIHWLEQMEQMPEQVVQTNIRLFQAYISTLLINGLAREARPLIETLPYGNELDLTPDQRGWHALHQATLATADGRWDETLVQSYRSLGFFPEFDAVGRSFAWSFVYTEEAARGNRELAQIAVQQAEIARNRQVHESAGWHFHLQPAVANDRALQGDLTGAAELFHHFIQSLPPSLNESLSKFRKGLLAIALEQNRLDLAAAEVAYLEADMKEREYSIWHIEALVSMSRYDLAIGDTEGASRRLDEAVNSSRQHGGLADVARARTAVANYWLASGQHTLFKHWFVTTMLPPNLAHNFADIEPRLLHLRWLVQQRNYLDAVRILTESMTLARDTGNHAAEIAFLVWSAIIAQETGDPDTANHALRHALELGAPGRFHRVFTTTGFDLSDRIRALLPTLSESARLHATSLLGPGTALQPNGDHLPWDIAGLTLREREVLIELIGGKSNRDIAQGLFITERTVKKHLSNLFQKTGTSSRVELALWGREHGGAAAIALDSVLS